MRNFLDVNGTISGTFSRHKPTKPPFAVSKDDFLASHQQPWALKINVNQGCSSRIQHHVSNTESQLQSFGVAEKCASFNGMEWNLKPDPILLTLTPVAWYCWDAGNLTWCHFLSE